MRLWSLHPKYLDSKGLVALWREALLAKKVLLNETKGYKTHPQLIRFRKTKYPLGTINAYLFHVYCEALKRGYCFDKTKFGKSKKQIIHVTKGQITFEMIHLLKKLKLRDLRQFEKYKKIKIIQPHPMFKVIDGEVETWEK